MARRDKLVDLEVELLKASELSYRVHDGSKAVWVPKAESEFVPHPGSERMGILTLPQWLAIDKALV